MKVKTLPPVVGTSRFNYDEGEYGQEPVAAFERELVICEGYKVSTATESGRPRLQSGLT